MANVLDLPRFILYSQTILNFFKDRPKPIATQLDLVRPRRPSGSFDTGRQSMVSMKPADCLGRASLLGMEAQSMPLWIVSPILRHILTSMSRYDRPSHQVYMYFFKRGGWQIQFLEADLKTALPRKLTFTDPEKIRAQMRRHDTYFLHLLRAQSWVNSELSRMHGGPQPMSKGVRQSTYPCRPDDKQQSTTLVAKEIL